MTASLAEETIVAIATPPGRGGIGIVRLSGPDAQRLLLPHLELRSSLLPGRARYCAILDSGARLDEGVRVIAGHDPEVARIGRGHQKRTLPA